MSTRVLTVKPSPVKGSAAVNADGSILQAFTLSKTDELVRCQNPVCSVEFKQTGLAMEPKRFCDQKCRMSAWFIKKVAKIYGLTIDQVHDALSRLRDE